jgi:uncharacterized RDD family membrane protein YckC
MTQASLGDRFMAQIADGLVGLDIRVVDAESRRPCSFGQSFIRNVCLSALGPIDWLFIFGERRQRLGDRAAGTNVVVAAR